MNRPGFTGDDVVTLTGRICRVPRLLLGIWMITQLISYKRRRLPPAIITHAVWLYCRFNLSLREVEEMFLECGVDVSYETIRRWVAKFGPSIARVLRRKQPRSGDIWHLDEVVVKIKGRKFWL